MRRMAGAALYVVALMSASCVDDTRNGDVIVSIDTVAGVEHIRSSGEAPEILLDPVVQVGETGDAGTAAPNEFEYVPSVTLGPDGLLYVAEFSQIVVFDTTGMVVRTIGRAGSGPGEFGTLYSIAWMGDTLLTMDLSQRRIGYFSREFEWVTSVPAFGTLSAMPMTFRLYRVGPREVYQFAYRTGAGYMDPVWRRVTKEDKPEEWPRGGPPLETPFPDKVVCTIGRGFSWFEHPYATRWLEHPAPGQRTYSASSAAYRIVLTDSSADTIRIIERDVEAPLLNDRAWAPHSARFQEWLGTGTPSGNKDPAQCKPRELVRPERKPMLDAIMVDVVGRLWVERHVENGTRWELFDDRGRLIGQMRGFDHDRHRMAPWFGENHVAWVTRDSLDVPHVHLARIRKPED